MSSAEQDLVNLSELTRSNKRSCRGCEGRSLILQPLNHTTPSQSKLHHLKKLSTLTGTPLNMQPCHPTWHLHPHTLPDLAVLTRGYLMIARCATVHGKQNNTKPSVYTKSLIDAIHCTTSCPSPFHGVFHTCSKTTEPHLCTSHMYINLLATRCQHLHTITSP